ncbi:hypothetical protein OE88DRAFT_1730885 [Heliocybe sulcata]|uniref:Uncharacterized protein n=1 Tax=Heliocybe sulcata TaxID=5364 RepID=A0A5C3NJY9_9AGAM|nr:hypothetical protein OE88DRAFT_1730885 [Heliocybe sulcata]
MPTLPRATLTDDDHLCLLQLPCARRLRPTFSNDLLIRKPSTLLRTTLTDNFRLLPSSTSVRKTPTLPRAILTDDQHFYLLQLSSTRRLLSPGYSYGRPPPSAFLTFHAQDAYAPPGYPYGQPASAFPYL